MRTHNFISLSLIATCVVCAQPNRPTHSLADLRGYWINLQYLDTLRNAFSPQRALTSPTGCIPYLDFGKSGFQWLNCFHDGEGSQIVDWQAADKPLEYRFRAPFYSEDKQQLIRLNKDIPDSLIWKRAGGTSIPFMRIHDTPGSYISKFLFEGSWIDQTGRIVTFSRSGYTNILGDSLYYSVALDWYGAGEWDILYIKGNNGLGFRRVGDSVVLFRLEWSDDSERFTKEKELVYTLRRPDAGGLTRRSN